jgi:pyridoxine 5-phosphate synthase
MIAVRRLRLLTVPHLAELNIGHTLIARSMRVGLTEAVKEMRAAMKGYAL